MKNSFITDYAAYANIQECVKNSLINNYANYVDLRTT